MRDGDLLPSLFREISDLPQRVISFSCSSTPQKTISQLSTSPSPTMWPFPLSVQPDYHNNMPQAQPPLPQHHHSQTRHHHSPASRQDQRPEVTDQGHYDYSYLFRPDQHHSYDSNNAVGSVGANQPESNARTGAAPSSTPWNAGGPYTATSGTETSWDWYTRQQSQGPGQQQQRDQRSPMGYAQGRLTGPYGWPESRDGYGHPFYCTYAGVKKEDEKDGERSAKKPRVDAPVNVENELAQVSRLRACSGKANN